VLGLEDFPHQHDQQSPNDARTGNQEAVNRFQPKDWFRVASEILLEGHRNLAIPKQKRLPQTVFLVWFRYDELNRNETLPCVSVTDEH
jgi:hypothetical protein